MLKPSPTDGDAGRPDDGAALFLQETLGDVAAVAATAVSIGNNSRVRIHPRPISRLMPAVIGNPTIKRCP